MQLWLEPSPLRHGRPRRLDDDDHDDEGYDGDGDGDDGTTRATPPFKILALRAFWWGNRRLPSGAVGSPPLI